eukprot:11176280-Lingulodinium_polyedra.AAC.1
MNASPIPRYVDRSGRGWGPRDPWPPVVGDDRNGGAAKATEFSAAFLLPAAVNGSATHGEGFQLRTPAQARRGGLWSS